MRLSNLKARTHSERSIVFTPSLLYSFTPKLNSTLQAL